MVTFYFFVRGALERLMGATPAPPARRAGALAVGGQQEAGRTEYQRAIFSRGDDGILQARITGSQGSGVLRSMSEADCMMVLGARPGHVAVGDWVEVIPFHGLL